MSSVGKAARAVGLAGRKGVATGTQSGNAATSLGEVAYKALLSQRCRRGMASGGHGGDHGVTYAGLTLHKPLRWQVAWAHGLSGLMWFWILYRGYNDWDTFAYGHAQHWEHEGEDDDDAPEHGHQEHH